MKIPEEIHDIFLEVQACTELRDKSIESFFSKKRAIYYAKMRIKLNLEAWEAVGEIYPETRIGHWEYKFKEKEVVKVNEP